MFAKGDPLGEKIVSCPRNKLSKSQTLLLDSVDFGVLLSDFAQKYHRKNADVPDIYFASLDAAGMSPILVLNENVRAKEKGSWVTSEI